jgi:hypothetical protein
MKAHERRRGSTDHRALAHGGSDAIGDVRLRLALTRRKARRAQEAEEKRQKSGASDKATSARSHAGALGHADVTFSTAEGEEDAETAGNLFAEDDVGEGAPGDATTRVRNPGGDDAVFRHPHMEHAKEKDDETVAELSETVEHGSELDHATGGHGLPEALVIAAQAPKIVALLQRGEYLKAFKSLAGYAKEEIAEALAHVCTKLGLARAAGIFKTFVEYGTELNVLLALVEWTHKGFESIHEAHERGDQETRIDLYADAYAHAFLFGERGAGQAGLRAATDEEREAVELGRRDGAAAAGATGELAPVIGHELLERYGSPEAAARHIKRHLLEQAGLGRQAVARSGA